MIRTTHDRKVEAACAYLAAPGMAAEAAVLEEARTLLRTGGHFPGLIPALARAGRMELLDIFEETHGPDIWRQAGITDQNKIEEFESLEISEPIKDRIYRSAVSAMGKAMRAHLVVALGRAGSAGSKVLMRALIEGCPPDNDELAQILLDPRVTESPAFRRQPKLVAELISRSRFDEQTALKMSIDCMSRAQLRSFALLAKVGAARHVSDKLATSSASKECKALNARLASSHGRLALISDLPELPALVAPAWKTLRSRVEAALPAA